MEEESKGRSYSREGEVKILNLEKTRGDGWREKK